MQRVFRGVLTAIVLGVGVGCATDDEHAGHAAHDHAAHDHAGHAGAGQGHAQGVAVDEAVSTARGWRETRVDDLLVRWRPSPDPIPLNELFNVDVVVSHVDGGPAKGVSDVRVDARMPAHGHGMTRQAQVVLQGTERAHATGLLFHMVGDWEVMVDIYRDQRWIRAAWDETLD